MFKQICTKYKSIRKMLIKRELHFLKITSIEGNPLDKSTEVCYQVRGKSTVSRDTPKKLVNDLGLLTGFSKCESNLILNLFISEQLAPRWKISHITFSEDGDKLHVLDTEENRFLHFSPSMLLESESLLDYFDKDDLRLIFKLACRRMNSGKGNFSLKKTGSVKNNGLYVIKK